MEIQTVLEFGRHGAVEHFGISEAKVGLGDDAACGMIFSEITYHKRYTHQKYYKLKSWHPGTLVQMC